MPNTNVHTQLPTELDILIAGSNGPASIKSPCHHPYRDPVRRNVMAGGSRQFHKKSRNGCRHCKKRRVKVRYALFFRLPTDSFYQSVRRERSLLWELPETQCSLRIPGFDSSVDRYFAIFECSSWTNRVRMGLCS